MERYFDIYELLKNEKIKRLYDENKQRYPYSKEFSDIYYQRYGFNISTLTDNEFNPNIIKIFEEIGPERSNAKGSNLKLINVSREYYSYENFNDYEYKYQKVNYEILLEKILNNENIKDEYKNEFYRIKNYNI